MPVSTTKDQDRFDIAPFGFPNCPAGEVRFEEPRDIEVVEAIFEGPAPDGVKLQYLRKYWPHERFERLGDMDIVRPSAFGWMGMDDQFTPEWVDAETADAISTFALTGASVLTSDPHTVRFTFRSLRSEVEDFPGAEMYDVTFRRTLAVRVVSSGVAPRVVRVFTRSLPGQTALRVELNAGRQTPARTIAVSGYNAVVARVTAGPGTRAEDGAVHLEGDQPAYFALAVDHMQPAHRYAHDDGHLLFTLGEDAFTISLTALEAEGPIWYAEAGIYIARVDDPTTFERYRERNSGAKTIAARVTERPEQSLAGAMNGQPRPHPIAFCFGGKHARQKFWLEPSGDLVLTSWLVKRQPGPDTPRYKNEGDGRFFFGLERWTPEGRHNDPWPVMGYNIQCRRGDIRVRQKAFAAPLARSILKGEGAPDEPFVALVRFRFENTGDRPALAELPLEYAQKVARTQNRRLELGDRRRPRYQTDTLVPIVEREPLAIEGDRILGAFQGEPVLRAAFETDMAAEKSGSGVSFRKTLAPGEECELLLRIPFIGLESDDELAALRGLDFVRCHTEMARYWRAESRKGAQIRTPDAHLNAAYAGHLPIILMSDLGHPDGSGLVNTTVGSCTYGNFTNESVMILEELEQRGLPDEVRRRLAVWVRYQGTVGLRGRFTDHDDIFYGADGIEMGDSYNQHHGWALWYLAVHYLHTGDRDWFASVVESVVRGSNWLVRQLEQTRGGLPQSRGWERGFLPAGALEDVDDYFYWLSTNALTWRGLDAAARALAQFGHPDAARFQAEANTYRDDLKRGFETSRRHSPLIRLRDGRWIPHYPSRLYCRGRDFGWIREVLEGSVYLLLSGLYAPNSREAVWILDDFQDTRYMNPPFGYIIDDPQTQWYDCGGFSVQPNLLAGLMPYLDRDEIEVYLWMFFNAWAACYREEVQAMVEHPVPVLGFSNSAPFKTSDQANAMKWLAYMFVYDRDGLLHLGRAVPRAWFAGEEDFGAERLSSSCGTVSVVYRPRLSEGRVDAEVEFEMRNRPQRLLLRFRHPEKKFIRSVEVNGAPHGAFDALTGDVMLPVSGGKALVRVTY